MAAAIVSTKQLATTSDPSQAAPKQLHSSNYAQNVAQKKCRAQDVFPCTSTGQLNPHSSCLWSDSGCGYACLKEVADDLDLW